MSDIIKHQVCIYVQSQKSELSLSLSTVLGNLGVNTIKFCKDFNNYTSNLPVYFKLKVFIDIFEDRSFKFKVFLPNTSIILNLLKFNEIEKFWDKDRFKERNILCIRLAEVVKLSVFKFPKLPIFKSFWILCGIINSMKLIIVY